MALGLKIIIGLLVGTFGLGYAVEAPDLVMAYSPKNGRLVDQATGVGIPDAWVVARASMSSSGLYQTSHGCLFAAAGRSNQNGNYSVPGGWSHVSPGAPWFGPHTTWSIEATKPGYVTAAVVNASADAGQTDAMGLATPPASWKGRTVSVADIRMEKGDFSIRQKVDYYAKTFRLGCEKVNPDVFRQVQRAVFEDLKTNVCALGPEGLLDVVTMRGLAGFSTNLSGDSGSVERFNQQMTQHDAGYSEIAKESAVHEFHASDVCQVMTAIGSQQ